MPEMPTDRAIGSNFTKQVR